MVGRRRGLLRIIQFTIAPMTSDTSEYLCQGISLRLLNLLVLLAERMLCPLATFSSVGISHLLCSTGSSCHCYRRVILFGFPLQKITGRGVPALLAGESRVKLLLRPLDNIAVNEGGYHTCFKDTLIGFVNKKSSAVPRAISTISQRRRLPDCCTRPRRLRLMQNARSSWGSRIL